MHEEQQAKTERDLVIEYRDAKAQKEQAELLLEQANAKLEKAGMALVELLEAQDKKSTAKYEGIGFVILNKPKVYARFDKENEPIVFEFLKNEKREDLIKPTINSQTLSSFVKERLELGQAVPDFLPYYLKPSLTMRQA